MDSVFHSIHLPDAPDVVSLGANRFGTIRLYRVVNGVRQLIKNQSRTVKHGEWHTLRVIQHDCEIQVRYDDEPIFQLCDNTFSQGRIGLWTTSDAVTYFDDLQLRSLNE